MLSMPLTFLSSQRCTCVTPERDRRSTLFVAPQGVVKSVDLEKGLGLVEGCHFQDLWVSPLSIRFSDGKWGHILPKDMALWG